MLLTVAIALVLGVLQAAPRFAPLTAVLILAGWVAFMVANPEEQARILICQIWSGLALPASSMGLAASDMPIVAQRAFFISAIVFWLGPYLAWSIVRYFFLPRVSSLLSGCLALTTLNSVLSVFSFGAIGVKGAGMTFSLPTLLAVVGVITAGLAAAVVHGRAMRAAWRRSYRNSVAALLVALGPVLMIAAIAVSVRFVPLMKGT
jgi:hypothetical protein